MVKWCILAVLFILAAVGIYWFRCGRFPTDTEVLLQTLKEKAGTKMPDKKIRRMCFAIADKDYQLGLEALAVIREHRRDLAWNIEQGPAWHNLMAG